MTSLLRPSRNGFSLIETIVVVGTIGVVVGLLLPAVQSAREAASRHRCLNNIRQVGLALQNYHDVNGHLPPPAPHRSLQNEPQLRLSWMVFILPFIEHESLWAQATVAVGIDGNTTQNPPHLGLSTVVKVYVCASDPRLFTSRLDSRNLLAAFTSYIGVAGGRAWNGVLGMPQGGILLTEITDGTSNTLMLGERPPPSTYLAGHWYTSFAPGAPVTFGPNDGLIAESPAIPGDPCGGPFEFGPGRVDNLCDRYHFWSLHSSGANFLFADGAVRFLRYSASTIIPALATRAGGEVVEVP